MKSITETKTINTTTDEKQFIVDFLGTITNTVYSWEFNLVTFFSMKRIEINLTTIGRFSKLYQKFNMDDNSLRDRVLHKFISDLVESEHSKVIPSHTICETVVDDFVMFDLAI